MSIGASSLRESGPGALATIATLFLTRDTSLARIIHELSTATTNTLADTALRSVGLLDVLPYTPAEASVARLVSAASSSFRNDNS